MNRTTFLGFSIACTFSWAVGPTPATAQPAGKSSAATDAANTVDAAKAPDPFEPFEPFEREITEFLRDHEIPGLSLAVTYRGRLVLARGFGVVDEATGEAVTADSRFRIASLSKPITAAAILRLADSGRLGLDDPVFGRLGWDGLCREHGIRPEPRLERVTVRQLLQHRGGWDRDASFDPMFRGREFAEELGEPSPARPQSIIRCMLRRPLDFDPGERYAYSNFGYCLLGRLIERLSGKSYEEYVRSEVLLPLGARDTFLGRTLPEHRLEREVRYHHPGSGPSVFQENLGEPVPHPYGAWCLESMDAHGGWVSTASDLALFAAALDREASNPILTAAAIREMHARPRPRRLRSTDANPSTDANSSTDANPSTDTNSSADTGSEAVFYSCGWMNRVVGAGRVNRWHTGSLPGTLTIIIRRHDDKTFVALLNTRTSGRGVDLSAPLDRLLHRAADAVVSWPAVDPGIPAAEEPH